MAMSQPRCDSNPTAEKGSASNTEENDETNSITETYIPYIKKALTQLKPCQELRYYRKKMDDLAEDVEYLYKDIERCRSISIRNHELEKDLVKQTSEIAKLQRVVSELQESLSEEREQVLYLYAENERLKIENREERRLTSRLLSSSDVSAGPSSLSISRCSSVPRKVPRVLAVEDQKESDEDIDKVDLVQYSSVQWYETSTAPLLLPANLGLTSSDLRLPRLLLYPTGPHVTDAIGCNSYQLVLVETHTGILYILKLFQN